MLPTFDEFFTALYGMPPFPWQARLAEQVIREGWPSLLDLPTGCGKTASLDVAVWALAHAPERMPRRVFMIIDRRAVVDQTFTRASRLADALAEARSGPLEAVADVLRELADGDVPLLAVALRGAIRRDDAWTNNPAQPIVAVSTVDQVGSRLLFRGYGVSRGLRSIHAGLVGNDALLLLDEVHLAQPFADTLRVIARHYRSMQSRALPERWSVVELSATPRGGSGEQPFQLDASDRAHPELARRLHAEKPTTLVPPIKVSGSEVERCEAFGRQCAERLAKLISHGEARRCAILVNRVDSARAAFEHLRAKLGDQADVYLVTGRMRAIERTEIEAKLREHVGASTTPIVLERPFIVVATQCLEAGADLDFEVLVSECASLDALRQRFGRLQRMGRHAGVVGQVLVRADQVTASSDDPIYGTALRDTWEFLQSHEQPLDFGASLPLPPPEAMARLSSKRSSAPRLLPAYLDAWVQTSQKVVPEPEVALWLHGTEARQIEVQVIWRADIEDLLTREQDVVRLLERIDALRPSSLEAVSLPIRAVKEWLWQPSARGVSIADVECGETGAVQEGARSRLAFAWRGAKSAIVEAGEILPGDTLIVPCSYGGLSDANWAPDCSDPVEDVGEQANWQHRGRAIVRLHPALTTQAPAVVGEHEDEDDRTRVTSWLAVERPGVWEERRIEILAHLRANPRSIRIMRIDETSPHYVVTTRRRAERGTADIESDSDDSGSMIGVEAPLHAHLQGVGELAGGSARAIGLPATLVHDLELAGRLHDLGKADPRFQKMLLDGSEFRLRTQTQLLAKSAIPVSDRRRRQRAQALSGYPKGMRHELLSVAMVAEVEALRNEAHDWELVLHLVASHHGWCRPFAPVAADLEPREVAVEVQPGGLQVEAGTAHGLERLDSGIADRFWRLVRRYGWFGLAWLEAILRLADHRQSAREERQGA